MVDNKAKRQRGRTFIVDEREILGLEEIGEEHWTMTKLIPELNTIENSIRWLARRRLIKNSWNCDSCKISTNLSKYSQDTSGYRWRCKTCNFRKSIRSDSFFEGSQLSFEQIICLVYLWSVEAKRMTITEEVSVTHQIIINWINSIHEEYERYISRNGLEIGGVDENGEPIFVEIGDARYFQRKRIEGEWYGPRLVFGGVETVSKRCVILEIPDRERETLERKILAHVLPGSHIVTDADPLYRNVSDLPEMSYSHTMVGLGIDPLNRNVRTMWLRAKRKFTQKSQTSDSIFQNNLREFLFRNLFGRENLFTRFLLVLIDNYND